MLDRKRKVIIQDCTLLKVVLIYGSHVHRSCMCIQFLNIYWSCLFSDPVVVNIVQEIFKELAGNESCAGPLEHRLLPTLVSILQAPDKVPVSLPPVSDQVQIVILVKRECSQQQHIL